MDLATKKINEKRLRGDLGAISTVLDQIRENKYLTVEVKEGDDTQAVLVHPGLLAFLVDMYDRLCEAQATPDWGALRAESRKFKRIAASVTRELAKMGGAERISEDLWTEIKTSIFEAIEGGQEVWTENRDPVNVFAPTGE